MNRITRFVNDDQGADLIEYALLVGLISLAATLSLQAVGSSVSGMWSAISGSLSKAAESIH